MPKRRKTAHRRKAKRGGSVLGNVHNAVRDSQVISRVLQGFDPRLAGVVQNFGYGRKGGGQRGGFFGGLWDLGKNVLQIPGNVLMGSAMGLNQGIKGLGRGGSASYPASGAPMVHNVSMASN